MNTRADILTTICRDVTRVNLVCADPGATDLLRRIEPELQRIIPETEIYAEGWALKNIESLTVNPFSLKAITAHGLGSTLWIGARMDFARTREIIAGCQESGVRTIFLFDHWKHYTEHFLDPKTYETIIPDHILVPDELAEKALAAAWKAEPELAAKLPSADIKVFGHPAIEASCREIAEIGSRQPASTGNQAVLFLDPCPPGGNIGYTVFDVIEFLAHWLPENRPGVRVLVKPHPRQSPALTDKDFVSWDAAGIGYELSYLPVSELIAGCREVYGMTSITLIIASKAGKPVVSFQPGRNHAGKLESNPHLERFVIS